MTTQIYGSLSNYARLSAGNYLMGLAGTAMPTELWVALYSTSANPDSGNAITELAVTNYARVAITVADSAGVLPITNTTQVQWAGLHASHLGGIALLDSSLGGNVYVWADVSAELADGAVVTIAVGAFTIR